MKTLAIFSPNQNAYSETFIQAHRKLPFDIRFYFNGYLPANLEGLSMMELSYSDRLKKKLLKGFTAAEKKLIFSLKKQKVDAVLAEYGPVAVESLKVIKYLNLPLVVHFHGYDASVRSLLDAYKKGYQEVFDYAHTIIAVSEKMKESLLNQGCPKEKIFINTYGPAPEFFDLQPHYSTSQFIAIGRFVEKKAPYLTILAFKKIIEEFSDAKLIMIGEGPLLPICKDLATSFGMKVNIKFLGIQKPEAIRKLMEDSIAFVQHSVTAADGDSEGTPVAVLEAQAAGLPVVATYHAGIQDVVLHNETGLLCAEKDVEAMAENMMSLLKEDSLAKSLGEAGRGRIMNHFRMEKHLGLLADAINKASA